MNRYNLAMESEALQFPRQADGGATWIQRWRSKLAVSIGRLLCRLSIPGAVRDTDISDDLSGQTIRVRTGPLFTRIQVNGRDYYFCRITGNFDGTGTGCA